MTPLKGVDSQVYALARAIFWLAALEPPLAVAVFR